jgi:FkbM family methyltransferase
MRRQEGPMRDYGTAYDVFVHQLYRIEEIAEPRTIVDLGANVGYATLYFALRYPEAKIYAFEPHPEHFEQLQQLISLNGLQGRVSAMNAAVGVEPAFLYLSNEGTCSRVLAESTANAVAVKMIDFYEWASEIAPIDLLKIDIEGGEFAILSDQRFSALSCKHIIMEAHNDSAHPDATDWTTSRLQQMGFDPRVTQQDAKLGVSMIYAGRTQRAG